ILFLFVFFFSSRRRHTRSKRDWSSDVCSSDLKASELLNERGDFSEVVTQVQAYIDHLKIFFRLQSLTNLANNGRINKTVAKLARSEERRVGKERRSRRTRYDEKRTDKKQRKKR